MCVEVSRTCKCGKNKIQFHLRDNVLTPEAIAGLFCPECPGDVPFDHETMLMDNDWIIEYDMILAKTLVEKRLGVGQVKVTPQYLFDRGYGAWLEIYPGERMDIDAEKKEIIALAAIDSRQYLRRIHSWNIERLRRLREAGWRKARM